MRDYCLSKPGAEETLPFGPDTLVFKLSGKIFLLVGLDSHPIRFSVKADPDKVIEWREEFACVLPGYHLNKKHWNTIVVDGSVPDSQLRQWIDHSYDLIAGATRKKTIK